MMLNQLFAPLVPLRASSEKGCSRKDARKNMRRKYREGNYMKRRFLMAACVALILAVGLFAAVRWPRSSAIKDSNVAPEIHGDENSSSAAETEMKLDTLIAARRAQPAPAFAAGEWLNSEALKLESLRGHVVLIEFWTFGCYNCRNTLPFVKKFDDTYRERGLTVIGVHTPEFEREKKFENVRREVASLGIKYPVLTDNDYETWHAYGIKAWPTIVILDKQGRIRFTHIGEGLYEEEENVIKTLLAEKT
jgi:thiol-disulfide isomerase/thioredoxin